MTLIIYKDPLHEHVCNIFKTLRAHVLEACVTNSSRKTVLKLNTLQHAMLLYARYSEYACQAGPCRSAIGFLRIQSRTANKGWP
jgi:hypothetical protein